MPLNVKNNAIPKRHGMGRLCLALVVTQQWLIITKYRSASTLLVATHYKSLRRRCWIIHPLCMRHLVTIGKIRPNHNTGLYNKLVKIYINIAKI